MAQDHLAGIDLRICRICNEAETYVGPADRSMEAAESAGAPNLELLVSQVQKAGPWPYSPSRPEAGPGSCREPADDCNRWSWYGEKPPFCGGILTFQPDGAGALLAAPHRPGGQAGLQEVTGQEASTIHRLLESQLTRLQAADFYQR